MIFFAHVEITDLQFNFQGQFGNDQLLTLFYLSSRQREKEIEKKAFNKLNLQI